MKRAKKFCGRLMVMFLSTAMIFAPILQSAPVYAAETGIVAGGVGILQNAAQTKDVVSGGEAQDEAFQEIREPGMQRTQAYMQNS